MTGGAPALVWRQGRKIYRDIEKFSVGIERELIASLHESKLTILRRSLDNLDCQLESRMRANDWEAFLKG